MAQDPIGLAGERRQRHPLRDRSDEVESGINRLINQDVTDFRKAVTPLGAGDGQNGDRADAG